MTTIPAHFQLDFQPAASDAAIVRGPHVRFTVLTDRLIRLEFSPTDQFEDRPTQRIWYRALPVPDFTQHVSADVIEIETGALHLRYRLTDPAAGFTPDTLSIDLKERATTWRYGDDPSANLLGTCRTVDFIDGYQPLEPGLMSRAGWSVVDDSGTLVFDERGWISAREADPAACDLYFFGYGHDYYGCLRAFYAIAGQQPMIPRWILGNWWSRYWAYSDRELLGLMDDFAAHKIPLAVCIVDMDWHIVDTGNDSNGWTGYTWNRDLFPDSDAFIAGLHARGLRTALNLHPASGIWPHEDQYQAMADRLGIDTSDQQPIEFDIADPAFANAYLEILHHPEEARGVDFWWMDWQQGHNSKLPGLDPLYWLNHLHFYDLGRDGSRRTFVFSRWGGLGNHRYPIGFSGDSIITWASLAFQPYLTATSANVGYTWWSHDIGGHIGGLDEPEIYARWVQYGVFSPILRLHTTKGEFYERRPWGHGSDDVLRVTRAAMQLRHALIPYLYTLAWRNHREARPPLRPMYYDYPERDEAYACPHQYTFGDDLIAAPYVSPADPTTRLSRQVVWLPPGDWYHFFSGEYFPGDAWYALYGPLDDIPVFARAGAIIPLGPRVGWGGVDNPEALDVHIFAGADGAFTLYEDDGETRAFEQGAWCETAMAQTWTGDGLRFTLAPTDGDVSQVPAERALALHLHGLRADAVIRVEIDGVARDVESRYDVATETLVIDGIAWPVGSTLTLTARAASPDGLLARRRRLRDTLWDMLRVFRLQAGPKHQLGVNLDAIIEDPTRLTNFAVHLSHAQQRALLETLTGGGLHHVRDTHDADLVVLWNNHADPDSAALGRTASDSAASGSVAPGNAAPGWTYHATVPDTFYHLQWGKEGSTAQTGPVPRFLAFRPPHHLITNGVRREQRDITRWQIAAHYHAFSIVAEQTSEKPAAPTPGA